MFPYIVTLTNFSQRIFRVSYAIEILLLVELIQYDGGNNPFFPKMGKNGRNFGTFQNRIVQAHPPN